jgi:hypothetical protein
MSLHIVVRRHEDATVLRESLQHEGVLVTE